MKSITFFTLPDDVTSFDLYRHIIRTIELKDFLHAGALIGMVDEIIVLDEIINYFQQTTELLAGLPKFEFQLKRIEDRYPVENNSWLRATTVSLLLQYNCYRWLVSQYLKNQYGLPILKVSHEMDSISHNLDEVDKFFRERCLEENVEEFGNLSPDDQSDDSGRSLAPMFRAYKALEIDVRIPQRENLKKVERIELAEGKQNQSKNPFPEYFVGFDNRAFRLFKRYWELSGQNVNDASFLVQRMWKDRLMHRQPHLKIMAWMRNEKFLSDRDYEKLEGRSSLSTKADSEARLSLYSGLFKEIYPEFR